jgi:hypothetical protein
MSNFFQFFFKLENKTSTILYITCIAGSQYNFIHITRILFNFANDIGVPNRGPKWGCLKSGSQMGVSQIEVNNQGPK